jgi:hypothetical protein
MLENNMDYFQENKNSIWLNNSTTGYLSKKSVEETSALLCLLQHHLCSEDIEPN